MSQNKLQNKGNNLDKPVLQHGMTLKKERDQLVWGEVGPHPDNNSSRTWNFSLQNDLIFINIITSNCR